MAASADRNGVTLMVGHTFEHNAAVWKLREFVETNELGRLLYLDSARLNLGLYQSDVNVIWDLAPHDVSILFNHVLGATPTWVEAWGSRHVHHSLEDVAYLRLYYEERQVTANIHVSWLDPCKVRRVTLVGSDKMAVYNDLAADERVRLYDKGVIALEGDGNLGAMPMSYRYGESLVSLPRVRGTAVRPGPTVRAMPCAGTRHRRPPTAAVGGMLEGADSRSSGARSRSPLRRSRGRRRVERDPRALDRRTGLRAKVGTVG